MMMRGLLLIILIVVLPLTVFAAKPAAPLPQTGLTSCYDTDGVMIDCVTSGQSQDGAIRAGIPWPNPRFSDNGDGTVTDNLTTLVWGKDANVMKTRDPRFDIDDTYGTIGDGYVTWQHALDYIKKLNQENYLGFSDWRLPNINELKSLLDEVLAKVYARI